jgi:hypothetical protein
MEKNKNPLEDSAVKELMAKAAEADKKEEENAAMFNIDDFAEDVNTVKVKYVKGVGKVKYKILTMQDILDVQKYADTTERGLHILTTMLAKADKNVTYEKVANLPPQVANKLVSELLSEMGFLTPGKSIRGLPQM